MVLINEKQARVGTHFRTDPPSEVANLSVLLSVCCKCVPTYIWAVCINDMTGVSDNIFYDSYHLSPSSISLTSLGAWMTPKAKLQFSRNAILHYQLAAAKDLLPSLPYLEGHPSIDGNNKICELSLVAGRSDCRRGLGCVANNRKNFQIFATQLSAAGRRRFTP